MHIYHYHFLIAALTLMLTGALPDALRSAGSVAVLPPAAAPAHQVQKSTSSARGSDLVGAWQPYFMIQFAHTRRR